jgi:hypothetical protein
MSAIVNNPKWNPGDSEPSLKRQINAKINVQFYGISKKHHKHIETPEICSTIKTNAHILGAIKVA